MRHLIDTYIEAEEPRKISPFDDMPLLDLIVKTGIANAINQMPNGLKANKNAVAGHLLAYGHSKVPGPFDMRRDSKESDVGQPQVTVA
jgi:hypothetical protein